MEYSQRNMDILNEYKEIGVMRIVGEKYGITKERVRQIVSGFGYKKQKKAVVPPEIKREEKYKKYVVNFWKHIDIKDSGCWEWNAHRLPAGYGRVAFKGNVHAYSHRVAWTLTYGEIPDGLCVCHKCDNPPCINPDHLFLGTMADNAHDRDRKGRARGGRPKTRC